MSTVQWNPEQAEAIAHRGGSLLVAAAAGAGKTAVLVERLLRQVQEPGAAWDIDDFLVVTFTRAAAAEMRGKIAAALEAALAASPGDRRLRRQLARLPRAQISTVHGFCVSLLREHFQTLGLSPDFRVADSDELAVLRGRVLTELIEGRYEDQNPENEGFFLLVDSLSAQRDDRRLFEVIQEAHEKLAAHPDPEAWGREMLRLAQDTGRDPAETVYGRLLLRRLESAARHAGSRLEAALAQIRGAAELAPYEPAFMADLDNIRRLLGLLEGGAAWDEIYTHVQASAGAFPRLGQARKASEEDRNRVKTSRDDWKKQLQRITQREFFADAAGLGTDSAAVLPVCRALLALVADYDAACAAEKRRRNLVDFHDLEHLTLRLLTVPDGEGNRRPSPLADNLAARLREIMVDEYQDSNAVQNAIFQALARDNLFLVGDMKQSIYRFRLADPSIFLDKYTSYADTPADQGPRRVILSRNYRSRPQVLDAVNRLFAAILSRDLGELDYGDRERLYAGAEYAPLPEGDAATELCLLDCPQDAPQTEGEGAADTAARRRVLAEARWVAGRVRELLLRQTQVRAGSDGATRPLACGDIAILLRSHAGRAAAYAQALREIGLPAAGDAASSIYDSVEVQAVLQFLACIDNPHQDVALAAVCRMPVYAFSGDELAALRVPDRRCEFYESLFRAAEADEAAIAAQPVPAVYRAAGEKARRLLTDLERFREMASELPLTRFLWELFAQTTLFGLYGAMAEGEVRQANLRALFEEARRFERAGYRGLYRFVALQRRLAESGARRTAAAPSGGGANAVRIMSIHKSKGLEFPVVFLPDCAGAFNTQDYYRPVLLHPKLGVGLRRRDLERQVEYPTLARCAITAALRDENLSEEMRVLYVAMTRARERLILSAALSDPRRELSRAAALACPPPVPPQALRGADCVLDWLLPALLPLPCGGELLKTAGLPPVAGEEAENHGWRLRLLPCDTPPGGENPLPVENLSQADVPEEIYRHVSGLLEQAQNYRYPHAAAAATPSKLTATGLKGGPFDAVLREDSAELIPPQTEPAPPERAADTVFVRPRFITREGLRAAERGTALHLAMQFIDFSRCGGVAAIEQELLRLTREAFLSPEQARAVQPGKIHSFFTSPLGQRLLNSPEAHRELRFSLLADAATLNGPHPARHMAPAGGDNVLLQGVVDCFFRERGEDGADFWTVVDFKTDYVPPEGGAAQLAARYAPQLTAYADALARMTGQPVRRAYLYLFFTGEAVEISL